METLSCFEPSLATRFRQRLARVEAELTQLLRSASSVEAEGDDVVDFKTLAQEEAQATVDVAQAAQAMARLREVHAARARLLAGRYGTCVECEEPIELRRLEALPETPYCAACRELSERRMRKV